MKGSAAMEGMTVVAQFEDRTEAEIACGLLVSAGIAATLEEHEVLHGVSESLPIEAEVGLLVPDSEAADATELLDKVRASGGTLPSDVAQGA
jgi:hypothetical protein